MKSRKINRRDFLKVGSLFVPAAAHADYFFAASASAAFTYYSVIFDGSNDYLSHGSALTGASNGKEGTVSFWLKMSGSDGSRFFIMSGAGNLNIERDTSNRIDCDWRNSGGTTVARARSNTDSVRTGDGWVHVVFAFNTANDTRQLYIDDSSNVGFADGTTDGLANWAAAEWRIGSYIDSSIKFNGLMCEFWADDVFVDMSVEANRRKFISALSKPVDLGADGSTPTGSQPLIYFRNSVATWETNLGSGGGFTENGALGDGDTDKP